MKKRPRKQNPLQKVINQAARQGEAEIALERMNMTYKNLFEQANGERLAAQERLTFLTQQVEKLTAEVNTRYEEQVKLAKEVVNWQHTVRLRDEAIERKDARIKELNLAYQTASDKVTSYQETVERLQREKEQLEQQVAELTGMQQGLAPQNLQYGKVLEREVEARIKAQQELHHAQEANAAFARRVRELETRLDELREEGRPHQPNRQSMPIVPCGVVTVRLTGPGEVTFFLDKPSSGG